MQDQGNSNFVGDLQTELTTNSFRSANIEYLSKSKPRKFQIAT